MTRKVMVIDDTADTLELVKMVLEKNGFECATFSHSTEGLEALRTCVLPDLLILDMRMPEMSGIDFCEQLRKDHRFDGLKIAFFTASSDLDSALLKKYGVRGFIFKPFDIKILVAQVNQYMNE